MKLLHDNILILIIVSAVFFVSPSSAADKLRIGYLSPDFRCERFFGTANDYIGMYTFLAQHSYAVLGRFGF